MSFKTTFRQLTSRISFVETTSRSQLRNYDFISVMTNIQIDSIQNKNPKSKGFTDAMTMILLKFNQKLNEISIENGTQMSRCCNRPDAVFKSNKSSSALFLCYLLSTFFVDSCKRSETEP